MSQQPAGWYDDPSDPTMLRYWDGVMWSSHTTPKKSPTASQSTIGLPQQQAPGAPQATTPMPQGSGWQTGQAQGPQVPQAPQAPQGQYPGAGQYAPAPANAEWMHSLKTTADGVPLASWGRRLGARLLDTLILWIFVSIVGWGQISEFFAWYTDVFQQAIDTGTQPDAVAVQAKMMETLAPIIVIGAIATLVYETLFLVLRGATLGKMAVGISVRRVDRPGPLSIVDALKRQAITVLNWVTSTIPALSFAVSALSLIDYLWPLWDDKRQALHDKIAGTQVVMGSQPRKQ